MLPPRINAMTAMSTVDINTTLPFRLPPGFIPALSCGILPVRTGCFLQPDGLVRDGERHDTASHLDENLWLVELLCIAGHLLCVQGSFDSVQQAAADSGTSAMSASAPAAYSSSFAF